MSFGTAMPNSSMPFRLATKRAARLVCSIGVCAHVPTGQEVSFTYAYIAVTYIRQLEASQSSLQTRLDNSENELTRLRKCVFRPMS